MFFVADEAITDANYTQVKYYHSLMKCFILCNDSSVIKFSRQSLKPLVLIELECRRNITPQT